jgi:hypothetical protein
MNTTETLLMVQLAGGTYGVTESENGKPKRTAARKVTHYTNGQKMAPDVAARLSGQHVILVDAGVKVAPGDIIRVVGTVDCDEAVRIRAAKYTRNWTRNQFVETASVDALRAALAKPTEPEVYAAMCAIRDPQ